MASPSLHFIPDGGCTRHGANVAAVKAHLNFFFPSLPTLGRALRFDTNPFSHGATHQALFHPPPPPPHPPRSAVSFVTESSPFSAGWTLGNCGPKVSPSQSPTAGYKERGGGRPPQDAGTCPLPLIFWPKTFVTAALWPFFRRFLLTWHFNLLQFSVSFDTPPCPPVPWKKKGNRTMTELERRRQKKKRREEEAGRHKRQSAAF